MALQMRELSLADALRVAQNMRELDRRGVAAILADISAEDFAISRWKTYGPAWAMAEDDGDALVMGGVNFTNDWAGTMWLVAIEGLRPESWRKLLRFTRTVISNALDPKNIAARHRIEAHVMADWPGAQRLVKRLGFTYEGTLRQAGKNGESVQVWSIVRERSEQMEKAK